MMVKTGEVYSSDSVCFDHMGALLYQKSRPRAIMAPTKKASGIMQAMQTEIFPLLREFFPGFIHAMNGKQIIDLVKKKIGRNWKAISTDGSAFDSSQFTAFMEMCDNRFWVKMRPYIRKIIQKNWEGFNLAPTVSIDDITENLMKSLLKTRNTVFIQAPTVNAPLWPNHIRAQFFKDVDDAAKWKYGRPEKDWIFLELEGTTFSGHSTRTTLGNTIRTLMYAWYYQKCAGISETPWDSDVIFTIASGDDCVMFIRPDLADNLAQTI